MHLWCSDVQVINKKCTPDLGFLLVKCRPFYLLREFTAVFIMAVYIPPHANATAALGLLHDIINTQEAAYPDAVFIISEDVNHCSLHTVLPKYHQYINFPRREKNIVDHVYCNVKGAYRAVPCPHFGQSDQISLFLYPSCRRVLKQIPPVRETVQIWTDESNQQLQDCLECSDWEIFKITASQMDTTVDLEECSGDQLY